MRNRRHTLLWMKDLIEHMIAVPRPAPVGRRRRAPQSFLTESLLGDLVECQRLCEQLRVATRSDGAAAIAPA